MGATHTFTSEELSTTFMSAVARLKIDLGKKANDATKCKTVIKAHLEKNEEDYAMIKVNKRIFAHQIRLKA